MTESLLEMCGSAKGCFRCFGIVINSMLLLVGAGCLAAGIWLLTAEESFFFRYNDVITANDVNHELLKNGVIALMAGGVAVLTFAAVGMVAVCTKNTCLLGLYSVLLALLMAMEVVPVVLAVLFKSDWMSRLDREVLQSLHSRYGGQLSSADRDFTAAWDALQTDFECCGWHNGSDYVTGGVALRIWSTQTNDGRKMVVPEACCHTKNETIRDKCVAEPKQTDVYSSDGCQDTLMDILTTHQWLVIGLGGVTLGLELLMIISSILMLSFTVNNKYNLS